MVGEESALFQPVGRWCSGTVHACPPQTTVDVAARKMQALGISSLVVAETPERPLGILTDRDLRNRVVAENLLPSTLTVDRIMSTPLVTVGEAEPLHRALYLMARHRIHRLGVTDADGNLVGILSQTDLLRLQRHSPHQLALDIEHAEDFASLATLQRELQRLVEVLARAGTPIRELVEVIAYLEDAIARRVFELTLPDLALQHRLAFLALGSQGRGEQTLATDQDNAFVQADDCSPEELAAIAAFGETLTQRLLDIGIPPCPGGIMTRNPQWRRTQQEWCALIRNWLSVPTPANLMNASMLADLKPLAGNAALATPLRQTYYEHVRTDPIALARMAQNSIRFRVPLGWFGRIKANAPEEGAIDLKKAGIFAITDGVRILAIEYQALEGNTFNRLERLAALDVIPSAESRELAAAFAFLCRLRLRAQLDHLAAGHPPRNTLPLSALGRLERAELRSALETVERLQKLLKMHYRLDLLRN
ncbi:putative nucleotidyltransferase substrate binding domain-containing protein [Tepidiphilus sp. J10]|uniref:putative nucleotidyltransferase substrate binding domain-containing protein n=1 Tax=Tepidiphilus sp. J10 TaxID=2502185 RepID=UPI00163DE139|nr:putative nucleotidyltransferase substrate binding domain-containing protein [Tepidiphilus sp. J10]